MKVIAPQVDDLLISITDREVADQSGDKSVERVIRESFQENYG